ncbi:MAG: aldehyde ferredoxin oxidoreductase C-terminal domain-containing protein [Deinococcales bacterium]
MRARTEGKLWAQGTARVGEHYGIKRIPVIKKQAISAYDPRTIEATGISMMTTAQGADHTAGNLPRLETPQYELRGNPSRISKGTGSSCSK